MLVFYSCTKDDIPTDFSNSNKKTEKENFNTSTSTSSNGEADLRTDEPSTPGCQCHYEIIDVIYTPPTPPNSWWYFLDTDILPPNQVCPPNCDLFEGRYFSDSACQTPGSPTGCPNDYFNSPIPPGIFSFNCIIPAYTTIPAHFGGGYLDQSCSYAGSLGPATITFKIHCAELESLGECNTPGGYGWTSPYLYSISLTANQSISNKLEIELGGECGCTPLPI